MAEFSPVFPITDDYPLSKFDDVVFSISKNDVDDIYQREIAPNYQAKRQETNRQKRKIMKNVIIISIAFFLNFTSYLGLVRLQSSLHRDAGMGVITSSIMHFSRIFACLLLPNIVIGYIGHKWSIPLGFSTFSLWMAANGYAVWGTMTTTSILIGISGSVLWPAQSSYLTISAGSYAKLSKESETAVLSRFFGIFYCCVQLGKFPTQVFSSLMFTV